MKGVICSRSGFRARWSHYLVRSFRVVLDIDVAGHSLRLRLVFEGDSIVVTHRTTKRNQVRGGSGRSEDFRFEVLVPLPEGCHLVLGLVVFVIGVGDQSPDLSGRAAACSSGCGWRRA